MYIKKISEFIRDVENDFEESIINQLLEEKSSADNEREVDSWRESLPVVANILKNISSNIKNNVRIVLEAKFAIEEKRADVVLVGTNKNHPVVIIIENKRWSDLQQYIPMGEYCVKDPYHDNKSISHPSVQVNHYKKTLLYTNKYIQDSNADIVTAVLLQNASEEEVHNHVGPFDDIFLPWIEENPIFIGEEGLGTNKTLADYINFNLDGGVDNLAESIYGSQICYSAEYKNILSNVMGNKEQLVSLLDHNQLELFGEIYNEVCTATEKAVYIVEGYPGTGKTFVAIALLAYLYQNQADFNFKVKLLLKNKDPRYALERDMGISGNAITYGLKGDHNSYDCLICDESHRNLQKVWEGEDNRDNLEAVFDMGKISVLFYDSKQHVHIKDYVTKDIIIETAIRKGISRDRIYERRLVYQHRCKDSEHFQRLLTGLFDNMRLDGVKPFSNDEKYKVALVRNPQELFSIIKDKNKNCDGNSRVLAGKGRSEGVDWSWWWSDQEEKATVGPFRNYDGYFMWNKRNYTRPDTFASDRNSVERVGCLDTSQGLDFEFVGVIIAPDLIYNPDTNSIEVNFDGHQQSDPNTGSMDSYDVREIIKNTYRVLLTRGIKGCFIYCCDENLQNYLETVLPIEEVHVNERITGLVTYVNHRGKYAYIKDDNGTSYAVSTNTYNRIQNPANVLVKDNRVSFLVWININGKKYANDIRRL